MAENSNKHLFELLREDQEPFSLHDRVHANTKIVVKRPTSQRNHRVISTCFSSSSTAKSPLSPLSAAIKKSPCRRNPSPNSNPILLHIPAKTAALLLEAASRIQVNKKSNPKPSLKPQRFKLFGSLLKRLTSSHNNKNTKAEPSPKIRNRAAFDECSSGFWSEISTQNGEEKSTDFSSNTSTTRTSQSEEMTSSSTLGFVSMICEEEEDDDEFCIQSPFRFVLQGSATSSPASSSGARTPDFSSPVSSPANRLFQQEGKEDNYETENSKGFKVEEEFEEEDKEQLSPVSVLDPPFEDDYDGEDRENDEDDHEVFDMETSYANVQRTKHQLLQTLRRFERLAELDPIELERRMLEADEDNDEQSNDEHEEMIDLDAFVREVLSHNKSSFCLSHQARAMKKLVSDLIVEEQNPTRVQEEIVQGVLQRFESWKEVRSNTIDMMVEQDLRKELKPWRSFKEEIGEISRDIEVAIFGELAEEMAKELVCLSGN